MANTLAYFHGLMPPFLSTCSVALRNGSEAAAQESKLLKRQNVASGQHLVQPRHCCANITAFIPGGR